MKRKTSLLIARLNIKSIINMQLPGEHAHCGPPLDPDSGFTYSPQTFMDNDSKIPLNILGETFIPELLGIKNMWLWDDDICLCKNTG